MSKKKGGKKGKSKIDQQVTGQVQLQTEPSPEEIPQSADQDMGGEPREEPVLSDAVSEVIGTGGQDRKESKHVKKLKSQIAKFAADGHDVTALEAMFDSADHGEIKKAIETFEAGINVVGQLRSEMQSIDFTGFEAEADELKAILSNPLDHDRASTKLKELKLKRRVKEISATLDKMVLPAMKPRVEALKAMLQNVTDLEAVEIEFSTLKMDYKAAYAEEGVKAQIISADAEPSRTNGQKPKVPMEVKDIFLLYKNGKFISHHRETPIPKEQQQALYADLKTGRNFLLSPKYVAKKLNVIPVEGRYILVQSGTYTVIIIVAKGSVDPFAENIITKVLTLMESEDQTQLKDWNGDVSGLKSCNKYMLALLQAFKKLNEKRRL